MSKVLDVEAKSRQARPEPPPHLIAAKKQLYADFDTASDALNKFPRGPTGLTPDHVKASHEYRTAKQNSDRAFQAVRSFNQQHTSKYNWPRKFK